MTAVKIPAKIIAAAGRVAAQRGGRFGGVWIYEDDGRKKMNEKKENEVITVSQAIKKYPIGKSALLRALREGACAGRFVGGSRGWVTTTRAIMEWIEGRANGENKDEL